MAERTHADVIREALDRLVGQDRFELPSADAARAALDALLAERDAAVRAERHVARAHRDAEAQLVAARERAEQAEEELVAWRGTVSARTVAAEAQLAAAREALTVLANPTDTPKTEEAALVQIEVQQIAREALGEVKDGNTD